MPVSLKEERDQRTKSKEKTETKQRKRMVIEEVDSDEETTGNLHLVLLMFLNGPGHAKMCLMPFANKGADQPAHPRSLISTFVVHCLDSILPLLAIAEISRP